VLEGDKAEAAARQVARAAGRALRAAKAKSEAADTSLVPPVQLPTA